MGSQGERGFSPRVKAIAVTPTLPRPSLSPARRRHRILVGDRGACYPDAMNPTSGVIRSAWDLYKAHWKHLVTIALVIYLGLGIVSTLLIAVLSWLGLIIAAVVSVIGAFLLQGALVKAVEDIRDGRADMTLGQTLEGAKPHIGSVAVASILAGLGIALGLFLLIAPGLFLTTIWAVIIPIVVIENKGAMDSFSRSRDLVSGYGWNVFGLIVLMFLLMIGVSIVLGLILSPLPTWLEELISNTVSGALTAPFWALAVTLLYFRLREAKEPAAPQPPLDPAPPPAPTV